MTPTTQSDSEAREFNDVRNTDALVREYRADGRLFAYRSDDAEQHVVVSRGNDPATRWEKRVPATRKRVVPGQKLWTIPDNWEQRVYSKRDSIAYGMFHVPETDVWVKLSIPTNNWLTDAWYRVSAVGDLELKPVGELAPATAAWGLTDEIEEIGDYPDLAEAVRETARNWDVVEDEVRKTMEWMRCEGPWVHAGPNERVHVDDRWVHEAQRGLYELGEAISMDVDLPDGVSACEVVSTLNDEGLLPSLYRVKLSLDESAVGMKFYVRALEEAGCTPMQVLDYYFVEINGMSQTERSNSREADQSSVSRAVSGAERNIGK